MINRELTVTLEQLVRDYSAGRIQRDDYRYRRRQLLEQAFSESVARSQSQPVVAASPDRGRTTRRVNPVLVAAIGIAALGAIAIVLMLANHEVEQAAVAPVIVSELPDASARRLVEAFVEKNVWDDRRLEQLYTRWEALPVAVRSAAMDTQWMAGFRSELEDLIDDQRALGPLQQSGPLARLALALGIEIGDLVQDSKPPTAEQEERPKASLQMKQVEPPAQRVPKQKPAEPVAANVEDITGVERTDGVKAAASERSGPGRVCHADLLKTRRPTCADKLSVGNGPRLVVISAGHFTMGSEWSDEEKPVHEVSLSRAFALSQFEVSHGEYLAFCKAEGSRCPGSPWGGGHYPVVNISWDDAIAYTKWLSTQSGREYRLPTESEWEYAARAGSSTRYPGGDDLKVTDARFAADSPMSNDDRRINPNAFRLYHTVGNVREWVQDTWAANHEGRPANAHLARESGAGAQRVARGGCHSDEPGQLRSAARVGLSPTLRDACTGLRVLRELDR